MRISVPSNMLVVLQSMCLETIFPIKRVRLIIWVQHLTMISLTVNTFDSPSGTHGGLPSTKENHSDSKLAVGKDLIGILAF
jgi:hypothetical protein